MGIVLTGFAFTALPTAFIPDEDQGYGLGIFQLQNGASLVETKQLGMQIAKVLSEEDDVANASIINGSGFNGSSPDQGIFFFRVQAPGGTQRRQPQFRRDHQAAEHPVDSVERRSGGSLRPASGARLLIPGRVLLPVQRPQQRPVQPQ